MTIATRMSASAARAEDPVAPPRVVTFDEIDHVYTSGHVAPRVHSIKLSAKANAIERKTSAGSERYTLVIERGNVRTAATAPSGIFEIPDGYRPV